MDEVWHMEITHDYGKKSISRKPVNEGDASLMLARDGSYLWTGTNPASRYQGWFLALDDGRPVKIVEDIRPRDRVRVEGLVNGPESVKKISREFNEKFYLPERQVLAYAVDKFAPVEIFFDIRDPYCSLEFGRNYRVWKENGAILISFTQKGAGIPEIFTAIWGDFGIINIKEEWAKRDYEYDRARGDKPCERWVFEPVEISVSRIVIAAALSKEKAIINARKAWRSFGKIKAGEMIPERIDEELSSGSEEGLSKRAAAGALEMLKTEKNGKLALRAGLPWFFQVWRRDEAVSLKGLSIFDPAAAKEIFWRQMDELAANDYKYGDSADAIGWLFLRAGEFMEAEKFDIKETQKLSGILKKSIERLTAEDTKNDLAINGSKQTWMDSLNRNGAAIEIQALRLNMYSLAARIADNADMRNYYHGLEATARLMIREKFFCDGKLADLFDPASGRTDRRARPNVFLAAYAYPQLLKKSEWQEVFDNALDDLWLDWGGLATLSKNDAEFYGTDTGVDPAAYHNGDSWFWINNLTAIVLNRFDRDKYKSFAEKIFEASANDILWHGALGCASEISPANNYAPAGCANQAWSGATFLELCRELKR